MTISTRETDEQFNKDSKGTGLLGAVSRAALKPKSTLGLDSYFRPPTDLVHTSPSSGTGRTQVMADQDASTVADSDSGSNNGWTGTNIGGHLPPEAGNEIRSYIIKKTIQKHSQDK